MQQLDERLRSQLVFLLEVDRLKTVLRDTCIGDGSRPENSAEHAWHLVVFALTLAEYADEPIDVARVMRMLVLHDVVEIDAGDTPLGNETADQRAREQRAAERLFGLLPPGQSEELRAVWAEFDGGETADARFAKAIDQLQPVMLNHALGGGVWVTQDLDERRLRSFKMAVPRASSALAAVLDALIADAVANGWLRPAAG